MPEEIYYAHVLLSQINSYCFGFFEPRLLIWDELIFDDIGKTTHDRKNPTIDNNNLDTGSSLHKKWFSVRPCKAKQIIIIK